MEEIYEYIKNMKSLQNCLHEFIEREDNNEENYQNFINQFNQLEITNNACDFKSFLYLLLKIANNHCRTKQFFSKIEKIILMFKDDIKLKFSNFDNFHIFKSNKRILLFLIQEKILIFDSNIANYILNDTKFNIRSYIQFFFFDIKNYIDENLIQRFSFDKIENFNEKRKIGENDDKICILIRNDLIDDFISFVKRNDFPLNSEINLSIFETNNFLLKKNPTLIEYAAFYGSTQIFRYLYLNGVILTPSLWIYAMHSDTPELIHLLMENNVKPEDESYQKCLKESIKCHHNDIANYIINNLLNQEVENYNENIVAYCFRYHNYSFFPKDFNLKFLFFYSCQYDYLNFVKILLKTKNINLKWTIVFTII